MNPLGNSKGRNTILIVLIVAVVVVVGVITFVFMGERKGVKEEEEVIARRVKIDLPPEPERKPSPPPEAPTPEPKPEPQPKAEEIRKPEPRTTTVPKKEPPPQKVAKKTTPTFKEKKPARKPTTANWVVNLASFTHRKNAEDLKTSLITAGYNAYITEFVKDNTTWYRVRVGFFSSKAEADKVGRKLSSIYRMPKPWITKPSAREVERFKGKNR